MCVRGGEDLITIYQLALHIHGIIFECTKLYLLSNSSANTTLGGTLYTYLASEGGAVQ